MKEFINKCKKVQMIEEDVNPSYVFLLMLMSLILLWWLWMVKIHNIGKRPWILSFSLYKIIKFRYLFLFHLITNQRIANGFSRSSIMPMALWQGTRFVWWPRDLHKLKVLISMTFFPLLHKWNNSNYACNCGHWKSQSASNWC